ncbi:hypothetical protein Daus18300_009025 [Diaporthe australafricana]|uniref:Uncharacterized protein n=1 Tax=Diaporthe australafricana TaxID=127596 RepID=A0ABR3WG08_9PEZI
MPFLKKILNFTGLGKKDTMAKSGEFEPTDIFKARYQDPEVLIAYVKTLPDRFTDDKITVKTLKDGSLGLRLPRKLDKEEIEGALEAFRKAEEVRRSDDRD